MVARVEKQSSALRNKNGKHNVISYYKKSIRHLAMNKCSEKGLTKRQQGLSCLAYYVIEVTSNEDLFVID